MGKILVVGASGTVGSEISKILKSKGADVIRATHKKNLDKDQVHLNLLTQEGLDSSLKNIEKLFLLSPPGHVNQNELMNPVVNHAKKSGVKKIVFMTAMGANAVESSPMRQAEINLEKSGVAFNIIRPNWFMQNFNSYWIEGINKQNKILLPVADAKGSFIDARDIAAVAAELLVSDKFSNKDFDLTGAEALNHAEVASILTKVTGRTISYQDIAPAQMHSALLGAGLPKPYADFMLLILDFFKQGYASRITDTVEKIVGRKPISFETYARDFKNAWC
jgi:uncharacterized protein YbjT (DUF2867 family)